MDPWNGFDAVVVIGSVVDIVLSQVDPRLSSRLSVPHCSSSFLTSASWRCLILCLVLQRGVFMDVSDTITSGGI